MMMQLNVPLNESTTPFTRKSEVKGIAVFCVIITPLKN